MPIRLKGLRVKKVSTGSATAKTLKARQPKDLDQARTSPGLLINFLDSSSFHGVAFVLTLPGGKQIKGVIGSSPIQAVLEWDGDSKLELLLPLPSFPSKQSRPHSDSSGDSTSESNNEAVMHLSKDGLEFLYKREAWKGVSNHLHWPGGASGVTLGPGYDMKKRTKAEIEADLKAIGVSDDAARKAAEGAGKSGEEANKFRRDNKKLIDLSDDQQIKLLEHVVPAYEDAVRNAVTKKVTQSQFDALVSLAYNIGPANFESSSVVDCLNDGDIDGAADAFKLWNKSGGVVDEGLKKRRNLEVQLFKSVPVYTEGHIP